MTIKPGDVFQIDLGMQGKVRPMVVVSRADEDAPRALVICVPITTQYRNSDYEVAIGKPRFLPKSSYANVQGIQAIRISELDRRLGQLTPQQLQDIRTALRFALEL